MPNYDREAWDAHSHKSSCPLWGDDEMIEKCWCGPASRDAFLDLLATKDATIAYYQARWAELVPEFTGEAP